MIDSSRLRVTDANKKHMDEFLRFKIYLIIKKGFLSNQQIDHF